MQEQQRSIAWEGATLEAIEQPGEGFASVDRVEQDALGLGAAQVQAQDFNWRKHQGKTPLFTTVF